MFIVVQGRVFSFVLYCVVFGLYCIWIWVVLYLDHLAGQLTPLWADSSLMVSYPPSATATVPHPLQMQLVRENIAAMRI